ncbi:mannitol repressor protein [mine drainage metagenome]|uniref:Mannitol repressor protein n=1 Tax=mine drainage metagenome TaxID=410659 RepID=A0A1J5TPV9_9ZZZZ
MAKPHQLDFFDWNKMIGDFHNESDRGAAVLAGSFVENYLAIYLRSFVVDVKIADELFQAVGPLSSFSQRIAVARAFGFLSKAQYDDLTAIRKIRNYFAHHPLGTSFDTPEVAQLVSKLSQLHTASDAEPKDIAQRNRHAYLFSCGMFCGGAYQHMEMLAKGVTANK